MIVAVFFPSLMGVGILISGALLIADWMRKVLPNGRIRKQHNVVVGIYGSISDAIDAAGYRLEEPWFLRRDLRHRSTYFGWAAVLLLLGGASMWIGVQFFDDPKGLFYRSPWATGLGYGIGAAAVLAGLTSAVLGVAYRSLPVPMRRLIEETSLGRIVLPTQDDHDAALDNLEKET